MSRRCLMGVFVFWVTGAAVLPAGQQLTCTSGLSLDGQWMLALDPRNVGRQQKWFTSCLAEDVKPAMVPWIIQGTFPGYHGVAWYWRDFVVPASPLPDGRCLLRFEQVDHLAEVWLNGTHVGGHEGGETPFVLDVTAAIKPGEKNLLAVRVLNPTPEPIDGISLYETARRCKTVPFRAGAIFNHGGITGSVTLRWVPAVHLDDLFVIATPAKTKGRIQVRALVHNALSVTAKGSVQITVASARRGNPVAASLLRCEFPAGTKPIEAELAIDNPRVWDLGDPYLYRVTARVSVDGSGSFDERSTRCGFRDFRFADGCFRLNGRRLYLRCSHTCNHYPIGIQFPQDPGLLRRDLINMKTMGFNAIRFIWGGATPVQLDLCDEIGLLVYNESYAAVPLHDSPKMTERFDTAVRELVLRDRNHPSVVIWGLLNETRQGPVFRHAVAMLPMVRQLDPSRMVMLNSGRWDQRADYGIGKVAGLRIWPKFAPVEPWVAVNATPETIRALGITWPAGHLALHPGGGNEYSVVRWTAPVASEVQVAAAFIGLAGRATTDVHVLHNGKSLFKALINLDGASNEARCRETVVVAAGDTLDAVVGSGNAHYGGDTTGLVLTVKTGKRTYDATTELSTDANPNGVWSYGWLPASAAPDVSGFSCYPADSEESAVGSLANPGSEVWEDVLRDTHQYPRVPHTANTIRSLRTLEGKEQPVFLSEYGIGSAVDLWRAVRHFEQRGAEQLEDAKFFREMLDRFERDWQQWHLEETFARPEDFFMQSLTKMAGQRTLGLNAIRSNPNIVGHSLTGAIDHVMCGEGLTTLFRELKPGTIDALFDAWAPLRWCLFAEPVHMARGGTVHLEAVLANEDVLRPGDYPVRLQVIGPGLKQVMDKTITVTVPKCVKGQEPPLAITNFAEDLVVDGPSGRYRFLATFLRGAAAAGGETRFHVTDRAEMPAVEREVVLWGDDPHLAQWLAGRKISTRPFSSPAPNRRELILASSKPAPPGGSAVFAELARRTARGSTVIFLSPHVFANGDQPTAWLPLAGKGTLSPIRGWLYLKDEWAKQHPFFEGMPAGGLMDYDYYRELIPDLLFQGQEPPDQAIAGAIKASQDYSSGLMLATHDFGAGRFVLNTLRLRENLATHPAAERLLRNLLLYAPRDSDAPPVELPTDFDRQLRDLGLGSSP